MADGYSKCNNQADWFSRISLWHTAEMILDKLVADYTYDINSLMNPDNSIIFLWHHKHQIVHINEKFGSSRVK